MAALDAHRDSRFETAARAAAIVDVAAREQDAELRSVVRRIVDIDFEPTVSSVPAVAGARLDIGDNILCNHSVVAASIAVGVDSDVQAD
ncbi:hypothetical protein WS93_08855 [Burkholderia cepacia]|nr:hypothetical protein WS93_08855 [Burkholderia cepacia]